MSRSRRTSFITVVATVGLALVLLISTGFALFASAATTDAVARAEVARSANILYANARFSVLAEGALEREYLLEPRVEISLEHAGAARALELFFASVVRDGSAEEAAEGRRLLDLQRRYLAAVRRTFAAVDAGDRAGALAIDHASVDPVFAAIRNSVYSRAIQKRVVSTAVFVTLETTQRYVIRMAIALSVLGLACLFAFLFVISAYRNRLIVGHAAEVRRIEEATLVDSLTKIGNHRAFKDDIERELARAVRHEVPLTLAMLDIDEFKMINDQNGHVHGDRVLVALADVLRAGRIEDRAYRLGGDEFALILPHTLATDARSILEEIRVIAADSLHGGTVSIGYATAEFEISAEALQNQADAALYLIKRGGRNGVSQFDASDKGSRLLSTERVQSLRALLASDSMTVAFQPIWDLERANILAFEALARLPAEFGFPGPQDAFDLAERIGCAHELDRASRRAALRRAHELPPGSLLFLNVSPQTLDRNFDIAEFAASVAAFGLSPDRVVIEITERSVAHLDSVIEVAGQLQGAGFRIALDDTGAGHAGLEIMSRVRFDYVKIDRAIIVKAMSDVNASGVVAAIVAFAQITGAYVIAEGIEDIGMLDFVDRAGRARAPRGRGIGGAQGYLLNPPSKAFPSPSEIREVSALLGGQVARATSPAGAARR